MSFLHFGRHWRDGANRKSLGFRFTQTTTTTMIVLLLSALTILAFSNIATSKGVRFFPSLPTKSHNRHVPRLGAVTSIVSQCSRIGTDVFTWGGNAVDAMIATEFCVGVVAMQSTGLGGGGFALIRAPDGSYEFVDFRETAPAAAFETMFVDNEDLSLLGGLASGIPGSLRGLEYLHKRYAKLSWRRLIVPSIKIARNGFLVTQDLINVLPDVDDISFLTEDPAWSVDFAPHGTLVRVGDVMTRKRYASMLEQIAEKGAGSFYTGSIARSTIAALKAKNGTMTLRDLRDYKVAVRQPLSIHYRNYKITTCSAPASGAVILNILKTIEGYQDIGRPESLNLSTHLLNEAIRFGYAARTELADPSFFTNITAYEQRMIKSDTAFKIRSKISNKTTLPVEAYNPKGLEIIDTPGTSHIVTADSTGLSVSLTSTVNLYFGSKLIVPETGLIMNNEMNDFSTPGFSDAFGYIPSPVNYIAPGKRPVSSMSPTIVEFLSNGTLYLSLGGAGGSYIITHILQCLWNILDRGMTVLASLQAPRFHNQLVPNFLELEYEYSNITSAFLSGLEHNLIWESRQGQLSTLRRSPNGTFEAVAEPSFFNSGGYAI